MRRRMLILACLGGFVGCGDPQRAEALRLCRDLVAAEAKLEPLNQTEKQTVVKLGRWSGMIGFGGIDDQRGQAAEAIGFLRAIDPSRASIAEIQQQLKGEELKQAFPQMERKSVVDTLERRFQVVTQITSLLERAKDAIPRTPRGRVPNSITELSALLQTYDSGVDPIADAVKELRVKFNIVDGELGQR